MDVASSFSSIMHKAYQKHQHRFQQSVAEPLHSQSHDEKNSPSSSSSRRNCRSSNNIPRHNRFAYLTIMLVSLLLASLPNPSQAKYRLVPKQKQNHNSKRRADNKKSNNNSKGTIILKPRKKKEESPINLKLEATVSKNENGQKVLLLSPESTQAVESAMQSTHNEVESNEMEAKQPKKQMAVAEEAAAPQQQQSEPEQQVLFYDPDELKTSPGEPPLPKKIYDEDGNEVDMRGKEALMVKPPLKPEENGDNKPKTSNKSSNNDNNGKKSKANARTILQTTQTQDQKIILSTVATMALLVGALSARRLRSRQFLSFCIENESLEDELAYDAAYTTQSTVGASSFYAGGGYDTFASGKYGGDLRWRGDLEKFDV